jgi:hypothetical protein
MSVGPHSKAAPHPIAACLNLKCRVAMFLQRPNDPGVCPCCQRPGQLLRPGAAGAVADTVTTELRRGGLDA